MASVLEQAQVFVDKEIERARSEGRPRLRGVRTLSAESGISHVTLLKAMRIEADQGRLVPRTGSGMWLPEALPGPLPRPARTEAGPKWQRLSQQLRRDILDGRFQAGSQLPATKSLLEMYGVCHQTLSRALRALTAEGVLHQECRRHRVALRQGRTRHGNAVVVCAASDDFGNVSLTTARTFPLLQELRTECFRANVELRLQPMERRFFLKPNIENAAALLSAQGERNDLLGGILLSTNLPDRTVADTFAWFAESRLPLATLDENDTLPVQFRRHRAAHYLAMSTTPVSGRVVGRFLLSQGHRRVAYISPHDAEWTRNRFAGLCEAFADAGLRDGARSFTLAGTDNRSEQSQEHKQALLNDIGRAVHTHAHALGIDQHDTAVLVKTLSNDVETRTREYAVRARDEELFEQALAHDDITAWVACNDSVGLHALSYLSRRGIPVPDRLSVVGFDDSLEAYQGKLTSYNFNSLATARSLMNHVLNPSLRRTVPRVLSPEIEGFVTPRASTRPLT